MAGVAYSESAIAQWIVDWETLKIVSVNRAAVAQYGYAVAEFCDKGMLELFLPEERAAARAHLRTLHTASAIDSRVWRHVRAGGVVCHVRMAYVETVWHGRSARLVQVVDVTDLMTPAAIPDSAHSTSHAIDRSAASDMVLATVAHELRQPLGLLKMAVGLMAQPLEPEAERRARAMMEKQVCTMTRLVDDLLDATRLQSGRLTLTRETLDLRGVVARAVEEQQAAIAAHGVRFEFVSCASPVWAAIDAMRFNEVLSNLLTNAVKYSPPGARVWVRVAATGPTATIAVKDEGRGIDRDALPHIFEPFVQAGSQGRGLGLGLSIARRLVELHGGHITASSDGPERGAEFVITLPLSIPAAQPPAGAALS